MRRSHFARLVILLTLGALAACASRANERAPEAKSLDTPKRALVPLHADLALLVNAFNANADRWRVVAVVSPTCAECILGAKAVQREILDRFDDSKIHASIVWIPMIPSDNEAAAVKSSAIFPGPRVAQFYDHECAVGLTYARGPFAKYIDRAGASLAEGDPMRDALERSRTRPQWDLYMLYAPGVTWKAGEDPSIPAHWIRHCGRNGEGKSVYWRDSAEAGPKEGDLFAAMRQMADEAIGPRGGAPH